MTISAHIEEIKKELPPSTRLVAVSKFKPAEDIMEAYNSGLREFGENRPQEMQIKAQTLPSDIKWHFIGHLQTNKVKMIIDKAYLIHSIDSLKLAQEIDRQASLRSITKDCLLQIHIAMEETKQGFTSSEIRENIDMLKSLKNVRICGVMGMASYVSETDQIRKEFATLKSEFDFLKENFFSDSECFKEISMGMSGDYRIAIEEGSTIVRIGTGIFGVR
ncbi:MAG: YggS family pyridoxal phosphate-dependent enzyme [Bacteroidia bacterium]|nr:YggS family pyridoxal phosphate-dependent enzyme [Bacteroidia bacterium]